MMNVVEGNWAPMPRGETFDEMGNIFGVGAVDEDQIERGFKGSRDGTRLVARDIHRREAEEIFWDQFFDPFLMDDLLIKS